MHKVKSGTLIPVEKGEKFQGIIFLFNEGGNNCSSGLKVVKEKEGDVTRWIRLLGTWYCGGGWVPEKKREEKQEERRESEPKARTDSEPESNHRAESSKKKKKQLEGKGRWKLPVGSNYLVQDVRR